MNEATLSRARSGAALSGVTPPAIDWADGDEAVFEFGMLCVEDLEIVGTRLEESLSLRERQTVVLLVAEVLRIVPLEVHGGQILSQ